MAKKKIKVQKIEEPVKETNLSISIYRYRHLISIFVMFFVLSVTFFKIGYQHYEPKTHDSKQWASSAKVLQDYNNTHKDQALWNPNLFGGMPSYLISLPNKYPFIKEFLAVSKKIISWRLTYLLLGAIGVYVLAMFFGFESIIGILLGLSFVLAGHFVGLLDIGHNTKFRAIMFLPWIIWSLFYLRKNRNLLGVGFLSAFAIAQFRVNHLQITYYTLLFIGLYWLFDLVVSLRNKEIKDFSVFTGLGVLVIILVTLAISNPMLSTYEYSEYTIRGGDTGLDTSYAQGWSMHPAELWSIVVPDLFGGISSPIGGDLSRYQIPSYWGWMSFTQVYHYSGLVILIFAILAFVFTKRKEVNFLWIAVLVFTIMSFGKYSPWFSDILLKYLPGFNKFRVPATILVISQAALVLLAGFGLDFIVKNQNEGTSKKLKKFFLIFAGLTVLGLVLGRVIMGSTNLIRPEEAEYPAKILKQLKAARLDLAYAGIVRAGMLGLIGIGLGWLYSLKKFGKVTFLVLVLALSFIDLKIVDSKYFQGMTKPRKTEIKADAIAQYLMKDKSMFRVHYPEKTMDNTYSAFVPTTSGYHGAKLQRYQKYWENPKYFNSMNFINMMNGKYILSTQDMGQPVYKSGELKVYRNPGALPKAWFVNSIFVEEDIEKIPGIITGEGFDPAITAVVEKEIPSISMPVDTSVEVTASDIHDLGLAVSTDENSFLVISEIYYPAGWEATIDGVKTEIYAVNSILRGLVVPKGIHKIKMTFKPKSYFVGLTLSLIGLLLTILALIGGGYQIYKGRNK